MNYQGREYKVLVVYPKVAKAIYDRNEKLGLAQASVKELEHGLAEVMQIVNLLDAHLLTSPYTTIHGLLDMLRYGWDIVWLVTHAEEKGWYLDDGIVSVSETTQLIRSSGTFLTVMNTCSSVEVAEQAALELGTAFICTIKEVPDRTALITGVLFAQKLAAGLDYVEAWRESKPGQNDTYRLIEARTPMLPERPPNKRLRGNFSDPEMMQRLVSSIEELERVVYGLPNMKVPALRDMTDTLKKDMDEIKATLVLVQATLVEVRTSQQQRNKWFVYIFIAIIALTITVGAFFLKGT